MEKILLSTAGVRLPGRARIPDIDHATTIYEYVMRGFTVTAKAKDTPMWAVSLTRFPDNAFVNQPEGTTAVVRMVVNYWNENAVLTDKPIPVWISRLATLLDQAKPLTTHLSRNLTPPKETP